MYLLHIIYCHNLNLFLSINIIIINNNVFNLLLLIKQIYLCNLIYFIII
jgi:hypothetical protein